MSVGPHDDEVGGEPARHVPDDLADRASPAFEQTDLNPGTVYQRGWLRSAPAPLCLTVV